MSRQLSLVKLLFMFCLGALSQNDAPSNSCAGYWELSYQHPYLEKADSLYGVERFTEALPIYQAAAKKFDRQRDWKGLLKARNRVADCFRFTPYLDSAFSILLGNLKIIEQHLENDSDEIAEVHFTMGICYDWNGQKENALTQYNRSLEIRINSYGEQHIDVARCYHAIGDMYGFYDQYLTAVEYLTKSNNILVKLDCTSSTAIGNTYYSLTHVFREMRDLERASIYGVKTLALFDNNPFKKSRSFNLIANIYQNKGHFEESLEHNAVAINLLLNHQPLSRSLERNLANYLNSFASVHTQIQQYDSAHRYYQQSLQFYNRLNNQDDILLVYQNIGLNYYWLGKPDSADYFLSKAVKLRKQNYGLKHARTSASLRVKGNFHEFLGNLDSALHYYQQAIIAGSTQDFSSLQPTDNPNSESFTYDDGANLLRALNSKGKVLSKYYTENKNQRDLELSLETLLLSIDLMDRNQQFYLLEGSTLLMAEDYYSIFEDALDVCYTLYQLTNDEQYLEKAFYVIERSKARLLFDSFSDLQRSRMVGIPDSLINVENHIKSRFASLSRNLEIEQRQDPPDNNKIRELENQVFEATVELESFRDSLESLYPSYTFATQNEPLELTTIREKVSEENQTLLNYFCGR